MAKKTKERIIKFIKSRITLILILLGLFFILGKYLGLITFTFDILRLQSWGGIGNQYQLIGYTILFWSLSVFLITSWKKIRNNTYFWMALLLSLVFLIFGFSIYSELNKPTIPIYSNIYYIRGNDFTEPYLSSYLACFSGQGNEELVIGDFLHCGGIFNGATNNSWVQICEDQSCTNITKFPGYIESENKYTRNSKIVGVEFEINVTSTDKSFIKEIYFMSGVGKDGLDDVVARTYLSKPRPVPYETYRKELIDKNNNRISLIFLIISLSLFSVFSTVKNLRDIIENK
jgi:hypothetical protein